MDKRIKITEEMKEVELCDKCDKEFGEDKIFCGCFPKKAIPREVMDAALEAIDKKDFKWKGMK